MRSRPFANPGSRFWLGWTALGVAGGAVLALAMAGSLIGDEWVHWHQIQRFVHGDYRVFDEYLTNVPGYHWLVTGLLWLLGTDSLAATRLVTAVFLLGSAVVFYRARLRLHPADAQRATAQFFFLPTLFVYGYLAYTDVPALFFLLLALLCTLHQRHRTAALSLLASLAMRQNNVLWAGFLLLVALQPVIVAWLEERRRALATPALADHLQRAVRIGWPYLAVMAVFVAYWVWNGSIAYSAAQSQNAHPDLRLDVGNPIFMLAMAGALFALPLAASWRRMLARASRWRGLWLWLLPLLALITCAWLFKVHHPFNFIVEGNVRNQLLQAIAAGGPAAWLFAGLAAYGLVGLAFTRLVEPWAIWWLPLSLAFVAFSWMIETRYTIIPFVLFLLLRKPEARWAERSTLLVWAVLSLWLAWQVLNLRFML